MCIMKRESGRMKLHRREERTDYLHKVLQRVVLKGRRLFSMKYECVCGYVYDESEGDPDNGIAPGTKWENVPDDYVCPVCGLGKDAFSEA